MKFFSDLQLRTLPARVLIGMMLLMYAQAFAIQRQNLPDVFQQTIPPALGVNLRLVELETRCTDCPTWRYVNFYSNESTTPIRREKISVREGYRAMYAYADSDYFANTKIEQSMAGQYAHDKMIVIEAITHMYARKQRRINDYLKTHPELKAKLSPFKAKGKEYMELEQGEFKGYEYISYTENVIGLTGNTISQIHIFVPEKNMIISAYLLNQRKTHFKDIETFLKLRKSFLENYIAFLARNATSK